MSGETAAIGVGFLLGGPVGAIIGGAVAPAAIAAVMWRSRTAEDDANSNGNGASDRNGSGSSGANGTGDRGRGNGGGRTPNGAGGGHKSPKNGTGNGAGKGAGGDTKKPKTKDPILDKLAKGLDKLKPKKGAGGDKSPKNKTDKGGAAGGKDDKAKGPKGPKSGSDGDGPKGLKDGLKDGLKNGLKLKDRGKQPASEKPWAGRGDKPKKGPKHKKGDDTSSTTARDGLDPKKPKGGGGADADEIVDGEFVPGGPGPRKHKGDEDEIVDAEIVDDGIDAKAKKRDERIALVRDRAEKRRRRHAVAAGKRAEKDAARDGTQGDPRDVKARVIREQQYEVDLEIHHENERLALATAAETRRSTPVNYPAVQAAPVGRRQEGAAMARQIDPRTSSAYAILRAMADQLANGLRNDDEADMGDHIVELSGIPNMCRNLSVAVQQAHIALAKTAPLHPGVIKHLNNASVAARTAGVMAENIMIVFVQAHREDIFRIMNPRVGEERWNVRNAQGTLDAAKLRAAILSSHQRGALPAGSGATSGGSKLVPASDGATKKLISLMKGFTRGHMVNVLSEVDGSAVGVDAVADSIGKLVRRMVKTWPTETVVDDTVARTAGQVRRVSSELKKAVRLAKKAHARELRLNSKGRAGKGARAERKWDALTRKGSN